MTQNPFKIPTVAVTDFVPGVYRHHKGGIYNVYTVGTHSETKERLVFYVNEQGEHFCRPYEMFFDLVIYNKVQQPRFKFIKPFE